LKIEEIYAPITHVLSQLEKELVDVLRSDESAVQDVNNHLMKIAGKRIRPALFFMCLQLWQKELRSYLPIALSIELIHSATLIHDDIVDDSNLRRGHETVNYRFGNHVAVLAGDYLFARAFSLLTDYGDIKVIAEMSKVVSEMSAGEIQQQSERFASDLDEETYLKRIGQKTACFFSACCGSAGIVAGLTEDDVIALKEFGQCVGMAFQIIDDVLDFGRTGLSTGKPQGADLEQGIITLPVIHMLNTSVNGDVLRQKLASRAIDSNLQNEFLAEMTSSGSG
jgi:heptaprenyl diphosphate synthase